MGAPFVVFGQHVQLSRATQQRMPRSRYRTASISPSAIICSTVNGIGREEYAQRFDVATIKSIDIVETNLLLRFR
jgi:hypothetical protein